MSISPKYDQCTIEYLLEKFEKKHSIEPIKKTITIKIKDARYMDLIKEQIERIRCIIPEAIKIEEDN